MNNVAEKAVSPAADAVCLQPFSSQSFPAAIQMDSDGITMQKNTSKILPHEMVMKDIVSRLSIQHLFQFRFISKPWFQSITQDPHFAKLHFDRSILSNKLKPHSNSSVLVELKRKNSLIIATDYSSTDIIIQLSLPFHRVGRNRGFKLCGICNGLLCYYSIDYKNVYIWNPLIKDHITIPCSPKPPVRFLHYISTIFGFGYDRVSNAYKLVRLFCEAVHTQVSVYTLGVSSLWRIVDDDFQYCMDYNNNVPFVNGVLHWLACKAGALRDQILVGFDVQNEVFREMLLPAEVSNGLCHREIRELGGLLSIFAESNNKEVHIWHMKEYGDSNSWTRLVTVAITEQWNNLFLLEALRAARNGEDMGVPMCNSETKTITKIQQFVGLKTFDAYTYVGSIISPTVISGAAHSLTEQTLTKQDTGRGRKRDCDGSSKLQDL